MLTIDSIRHSVREHSPKQYEARKTTRQAAVSVLLRKEDDHTEALFILRAQKEGDPWSGHMAFPGGHLEDNDESLRHAAERETLEEIGIDLTQVSNYIGPLDAVQANPRGRHLDLIVTPFVYELTQPSLNFALNYEVADVLWGSLNNMHAGDSHTMGEFHVAGDVVSYPGYQVGDEVVWGLTYRMVDLFFAVLDPAWVER